MVERDKVAAGAMLFDLAKDPHEMNNLANDPTHAEVVQEMKALLNQMPKSKVSQ